MDEAALTIKEDGPRAVLTASRPDDGRGLYKAWIVGPGGRYLLGTMVPEGRILSVRRTLSLSELRRFGAWPPSGAEAELSFAFPGKSLPLGWRAAAEAGPVLADRALAEAVRSLAGTLVYTDRGGFFLAAPWMDGRPFPLPMLFCFAQQAELGEGTYAVFCFDREGRPCFPNKGGGAEPY